MAPTLHFAYGSNMDSGQMARRCPGSRSVGLARLPEWRFRINAEGWATIVPEPGALVYGRLWELPLEDEAILDLYEELPGGLYAKQHLPVELQDKVRREAMVYVATNSAPGVPLPRYLEPILSAAAECEFPADYLRELYRWRPLKASQ